MITFVNNSGVISAFDDSTSPAIETKWFKDNLVIEPYGNYIRLTQLIQKERSSADYLVSNIAGATSANQFAGVLLGYLEVYGGGGAIPTLEQVYNTGNNVNGQRFTIDVNNNFGVGNSALVANEGVNVNSFGQEAGLNNEGNNVNASGSSSAQGNTGNNVNGFGSEAALGNTGNNVNGFGNEAGLNNEGNNVNGFGSEAARLNSGSGVNAFGFQAGKSNVADNSNFFGSQAGVENQTAFGVTVFSPESIPSYADLAAAQAAIFSGIGGGAVTGQIYLFRNESNNTIGYVIP